MSSSYDEIREGVGIARLKRGIFRMEGADRLDLLGRLSTADLSRLKPGATAQTILTSEKGRIVDLLDVIVMDDRLIVISSLEDPVPAIEWIEKFTIMDDVQVYNMSEDLDLVAIYGDATSKITQNLLGTDLPQSGLYAEGTFGESSLTLLRGDNLNGPFSAFLLVEREESGRLVDQIVEEGGVVMDEETLRVMRIEAGRPSAPHELGLQHNPLELGLVSLVSFTKGCYIGQEVIARLDSYDKVKNRLIGVRITEGESLDPEVGELQVRSTGENELIGRITSWGTSPRIGTVALAVVRSIHANPEVPVSLVRTDESTPVAEGVLSMIPFV